MIDFERKAREEQEEQEANYFAMCLLMPEDMIRSEIKRRGMESYDLIDGGVQMRELAEAFQVSETMLLMRLVQLDIISVR